MAGFVVCGDCNVDILEGRVGVTESNDRDGDFSTFLQRLMIGSRVSCNNKTRLFESVKKLCKRNGGRKTSLKEREL